MGPWPQPSPAHPIQQAWEVLNVPPIEELLWEATIGLRYQTTQLQYQPYAAEYAWKTIKLNPPVPLDPRFAQILFTTGYQQYLLPLVQDEINYLKANGFTDPSK